MVAAYRIPRHPEAFSKSPIGRKKKPREHDDKHLAFIRTLPCTLTGKRPVEAAHIRFAEAAYGKFETGKSEKPHDKWTVPLSPEKHREQHSMSEREFWARHGVDPLKVAASLWSCSGDDETAEVILREAQRQAETFARRNG